MKTWKSRYFIITKTRFAYFKGAKVLYKQSEKPRRSYSIHEFNVKWKGESSKRFYLFHLTHNEDSKQNMLIRCPSQRDAEDWCRCFAQLFDDNISKLQIEDEIEDSRKIIQSSIIKTEYNREETPKWAEEANKILKNSNDWELAGNSIWKKDKKIRRSYVVNSTSDICLEALLDKRGEWDFLLKNYRKISNFQKFRVYHSLYNNINIVMLVKIFIDIQTLISIEAVDHIYYPSNINFFEIYSIAQHPYNQNLCCITNISDTEIFSKSFEALKNYVEITSFKAYVNEINPRSRETSEDRKETDYSKPLDFDSYFIYGKGGDYERDPINGGLMLMDKDLISKQRSILGNMIKKIGRNILSGKSLMNVSIPVYVFGKLTLLQQVASTYGYSPIFLEKAFQQSRLERFKYVVTLAVSLLHLPTSQRKAFNPIIGETLQGYLGKSQVFAEQVCHHPPISSFQILADNYEMHGYYEFIATTSANSVKGRQKGRTTIKIEQNVYYITYPIVNITGTLVGKRYFNWQGILTVTSPSENLYCEIVLNPDKKNSIAGLFAKAQTPSDFFTGSIQRIKPTHPVLTEAGRKEIEESGKKSFINLTEEIESDLCRIEGYWTLFLDIDTQRYWSFDEYRPYLLASAPGLIPSDSSFRPDLRSLIDNNVDEAQVQKDILENIQRRDKKLRNDFNKN